MDKLIDIDLKQVWDVLNTIPDPEIPTVSIVELGMISEVAVDDANVKVRFTPTFSGCPAIQHIRQQIVDGLHLNFPDYIIDVASDFTHQWSSNLITDVGREKLLAFGLAPPRKYEGSFDLNELSEVNCPYCNSENTTMHSSFGPTLCRAVHYCFNCLQSFEQFKPL
ncbi:MAG: 1,2-phenylacetyl-CoA epoxidase subunit PaaD [Bacteroidota bacterium]|nr:1,2-phenylacetyl-CoA epoxidase subunit PaaD [Bacteroidota bacterium]